MKRSRNSDSDRLRFRQFLDSEFPDVSLSMSDSEVESLQWLVDPITRREAAQGLIPQIEALLDRSDDEIQRFFAETLDGLTFDSPAEARSWLKMFQAFLTWDSSD